MQLFHPFAASSPDDVLQMSSLKPALREQTWAPVYWLGEMHLNML